MIVSSIQDLLKDGWTIKMAESYSRAMAQEYTVPCYDEEYVDWAHLNGFFAETAYCLGLTEENKSRYLTDYTFHKVWPLNDWTRIWINDKLTLKNILSGTEFDSFMPEYYYYSSKGLLFPLRDNSEKNGSVEQFINLLKEKGAFACKPCNGERSTGFHYMNYECGVFYIDSKATTSQGIEEFISEHQNYIFTEYLRPSAQFLPFGNKIHTLRVVVLNDHKTEPSIIGGYLRLPCSNSGSANYKVLDGTTGEYNLFAQFNPANGAFGPAYKTYANCSVATNKHPDSQVLIKGIINNYESLKDTILSVALYLNTLDYLGFDIGITDKGFKCMEINSFPGTKYMQLFQPMLQNDGIAKYFKNKENEIEQLSVQAIERRNSIIR